jgi:mycothiol-dependent nitroreductase-like protein
LALRETSVVAATGVVVTVKVALVWPAGMVTLAGTVATEGLSLSSDITAPPAGAGPAGATVPVEGAPPLIEAGLKVGISSGGGVGTPILSFRPPNGPAFFGPVIHQAPDGEDALRLWDAVTTLAGWPGFAELKRTLRGLPRHPAERPHRRARHPGPLSDPPFDYSVAGSRVCTLRGIDAWSAGA